MTWNKDILHLFTRLSEQSFQNIINYGSHTRAILNLVVSTIVLYIMTYSLPFMVKVISPMLGIKRITGLTHFDVISILASSVFNFSNYHRFICYMALTCFIRWSWYLWWGIAQLYIWISLYKCTSHGCLSINSYTRDYFFLFVSSKICRGYGLSYYDVQPVLCCVHCSPINETLCWTRYR